MRSRDVQKNLLNFASAMHAIEIQELSKNYQVGFWKKKAAYRPEALNLAISVGETFGFLGPNGAGKTTTLKLLNGYYLPDFGLGHNPG